MSFEKQVKFLDLAVQYRSIEKEVKASLHEVLESGAYCEGPKVQDFEKGFAKLHDAPYCSAVNSGTAALHVVMLALDIGPGDEVIMPANTFFATPEAVSLCNATPVFVDCEDQFYNIDPDKIESAITSKTKAVIAVHLYGQPAQLDKIKAITDKHNLHLIEDSAQAHLATYQDKKIGTFGTAGCFSFYPGKNLGAYGEGGAVLVKDESLYQKIQALKSHGSSEKYYHDYVGHNYRMDGFQGAVLGIKQKHIESWTKLRQEKAQKYDNLLKDIPQVITPKRNADSSHSYHLYIIQVPDQKKFMKALNDKGIQTGLHYPVPCHLQKAYTSLGYKEGDFPISEKLSKHIVSLPMYPELKDEDISYVCDHIKTFFEKE